MVDVRTAKTPEEIRRVGDDWFAEFDPLCSDIYPGVYTRERCRELAEKGVEVRRLLAERNGMVVSHSYQVPELHKVADFVGDSLGLALKVQQAAPPVLHFSSVHFMAETAACMLEGKTRVFVQGEPEVHSCSLVQGTDQDYIDEWQINNPGGVLVTYVNSDLRTKQKSHYICTSANAAQVLIRAHQENPTSKILILPDKYLGHVMRIYAENDEKNPVPKGVIEVYDKSHVTKHRGQLKMWHADCYVHRAIGDSAPEEALDKYPGAILMLHPECGCANSCMAKLQAGILPADRVIHASTEGMLRYVKSVSAKEFIVGTEIGMIYRLRQMCPDREFYPISLKAHCGFMKENTMDKLLDSVRNDRIELRFSDTVAVGDDRVVDGTHILINRAEAAEARVAIDRMVTTKAA